MMEPTTIQRLIETALPNCTAMVIDDNDDRVHFRAKVVSSAFEGISLVKQHQLVYKALANHMVSDIHALALKTYTPSGWASAQEAI